MHSALRSHHTSSRSFPGFGSMEVMHESTPEGVCLVRYHDGTAKPNWGGRGTSLGLGRLVGEIPGYRLASTVNGVAITAGFGDFTAADKLRIRLRHLPQLVTRADYPRRPFEELERYAERLLASPGAAQPLLDRIDAGDEVWMNGEGDYLLGASGTLWRALILMHAAKLRGKRLRLTNSILSYPTTRATDPTVTDAIHRSLRAAASVTYRDPESLRLHRELFPEIEAAWAPDALFLSADEGAEIAAQRARGGYRLTAERLPEAVQELLADGRPYVLVSGSSSVRPGPTADTHLAALLGEIRRRDIEPILVATDSADAWMARADAPFVPADVPLLSAFHLMAGASAFVSGRYHPSIIAALVGTPPVLMASNSHKTESLRDVLGLPARASDGPSTTFGDPAFTVDPLAAELDRALEGGTDRRRALLDHCRALRDQVVERYAEQLGRSV